MTEEKLIQDIYKKDSVFWEKKRESTALRIFRSAAETVPAYEDFLKKNRVDPDKIRRLSDFNLIPPVTKKNYLKAYPFEKLVRKGAFKNPMVFTATSGSTGDPTYFPRSNQLDWESSIAHDLFLRAGLRNHNKPTLSIICFGSGVWIAGLITYKAIEIASYRNNYPVSIITPGINKIEIFKALKKLSPYFYQTILIGYPPFIKDIIDETPHQGINLKKLNLRILLAAEPFSERFREYLAEKGRIRNLFTDICNIYGTADLGTMAYETPISILLRRLILQRKEASRSFFQHINKTPTLAQYNPNFIVFESIGKNILVTGDNVLPLVRYDLGDRGGVIGFKEALSKIRPLNINIAAQIKSAGIERYVYKLPFAYVYERDDLSTTLYGLQIYPEIIREALLRREIQKYLTGKFTLVTKFDKKQNQFLEINLELQKDKKVTQHIKKKVLRIILEMLRLRSSEYRELSNFLGERANPILQFWPLEHPFYFKLSAKQKWVKSQ